MHNSVTASIFVCVLLFSLITAIFTSNVAAQEGRIVGLNVTTDKITYTPDDKSVIVSGCVITTLVSPAGQPVSIQVLDPSSKQIISDHATIGDTCTFKFSIGIKENLTEYGDYLVIASYGDKTGKTVFRFSDETNTKAPGECQREYCKYYFRLYSNIYPIQYKVTSGRLTSIFVDVSAHALMVVINSTSNGTLSIVLPRGVIDSKEEDGASDKGYSVLIGDFMEGMGFEMAKVEEIKTADKNQRTLAIDYPSGTKQIEIVGTYIVPEFSSLTVIVAAISMIGMLVWSIIYDKRTRLHEIR